LAITSRLDLAVLLAQGGAPRGFQSDPEGREAEGVQLAAGMARKDRFLADNSYLTGRRRTRYALEMTTHMDQNELEYRLARSQFLYEKADRKARARDWSKIIRKIWIALSIGAFLMFIATAPYAFAYIVVIGLVAFIGTMMDTHPPRDYPPRRSDFLR
jgi:hypothetical protein